MVVIVSGKDTEVSSSHLQNAPKVFVTVYSFPSYIAFSGTMMSPEYFGPIHVDLSIHVSSDSMSNHSPSYKNVCAFAETHAVRRIAEAIKFLIRCFIFLIFRMLCCV